MLTAADVVNLAAFAKAMCAPLNPELIAVACGEPRPRVGPLFKATAGIVDATRSYGGAPSPILTREGGTRFVVDVKVNPVQHDC